MYLSRHSIQNEGMVSIHRKNLVYIIYVITKIVYIHIFTDTNTNPWNLIHTSMHTVHPEPQFYVVSCLILMCCLFFIWWIRNNKNIWRNHECFYDLKAKYHKPGQHRGQRIPYTTRLSEEMKQGHSAAKTKVCWREIIMKRTEQGHFFQSNFPQKKSTDFLKLCHVSVSRCELGWNFIVS